MFWGVKGCSGVFRGVQGCPGVSRGVQGCPGVFRGVQGCSGVFRGVQGCSGVFRGVQGCSGVFRGVQGCSGVFRGVQGCSGVFRGVQGCSGPKCTKKKHNEKSVPKSTVFQRVGGSDLKVENTRDLMDRRAIILPQIRGREPIKLEDEREGSLTTRGILETMQHCRPGD